MTVAEKKLWYGYLRTFPHRVHRQRPINYYIVDFYCPKLKLVIEVDGFTHENEFNYSKDKKRDFDLEQLGFTTLRFSSWEVLNRIDDVSIMIAKWIEENARTPPPGPRQRGIKNTEK